MSSRSLEAPYMNVQDSQHTSQRGEKITRYWTMKRYLVLHFETARCKCRNEVIACIQVKLGRERERQFGLQCANDNNCCQHLDDKRTDPRFSFPLDFLYILCFTKLLSIAHGKGEPITTAHVYLAGLAEKQMSYCPPWRAELKQCMGATIHLATTFLFMYISIFGCGLRKLLHPTDERKSLTWMRAMHNNCLHFQSDVPAHMHDC